MVSARRAVRYTVFHLCALCGLTQCCAVVVHSGHVGAVVTCSVFAVLFVAGDAA